MNVWAGLQAPRLILQDNPSDPSVISCLWNCSNYVLLDDFFFSLLFSLLCGVLYLLSISHSFYFINEMLSLVQKKYSGKAYE